MIAMAVACDPKLIIADEPTTALDVTIQAQILELMKDPTRRLNVALIIITHNLGVVARYANRVNVMYAGRLVESGSAVDVYHHPLHPYTSRAATLRSAAGSSAPGTASTRWKASHLIWTRLDAGCSFLSALPVRGGRVRRGARQRHAGTSRSGQSFGRVPAQRRTGERCGGVSAFGRPLLEVKGLRMHFPITEGLVARKLVGEVKAIDGIRISQFSAARRSAWSVRAAAARPPPAAASCGWSGRPRERSFTTVSILRGWSARSCSRCAGVSR